jgi:hypothetical protein
VLKNTCAFAPACPSIKVRLPVRVQRLTAPEEPPNSATRVQTDENHVIHRPRRIVLSFITVPPKTPAAPKRVAFLMLNHGLMGLMAGFF